jgi:16S rRNA (guanine1516-N2)-methyltransferase
MTSVSLAVTTSVKPAAAIEEQAQDIAAELHAPYLPRSSRPLSEIFMAADADRLLIAGSDHLRLRDRATHTEYYFHPNMFLIRGSNAQRGTPDHFLEATGLGPGDTLLDCTLGFASEAALASLIVGEEGHVDGLESVQELALLTQIGLQSFPMQSKELGAALRRVRALHADYRRYLSGCADDAYDVIYFDPFFEKRLSGSEDSVSPLFVFGNPAPLDAAAVREACRATRRRVVIKHPRHEPLPGEIAALLTKTVGSRKSRLIYSIIEPL